MSWRVAKSLDVLLGQINAKFPNRSKASDGAIGDDNHQNRDSDHNPWYGPGIVTARDYTHDPGVGLNMDALTDQLQAGRDPRIKYVIFNRWIMDSRPQFNPWKWVRYDGVNPHTVHMHLSVMDSALCDNESPWNLSMLTVAASKPPTQVQVPDNGTKTLQRVLNKWYPWLQLVEDGIYGPKTTEAVKELQRRAGLPVDGNAGPQVRKVLGI